MDEIDGGLVAGLVAFVAVVDARGFGRAAERLGMTQSGVSRAVARLEARLGARLLDRTSRAMTLTDEGRGLYERTLPHLSGLGEAAADASTSGDSVRGRLRINVDPLFSRMVLAPKLSEFLLRNPMLELRLETRDRVGDLVGDGFDLAIRFGEPSPSALIAPALAGRPHPDGRVAGLHRPPRKAEPPGGPRRRRPRVHPLDRSLHRAALRVGVLEGNREAVGFREREARAHGLRHEAWRLPRRFRHCADLGLEQHLSTRRPDQSVSRLAGRTVSPPRLPCLQEPRARQGASVHRLCRGSFGRRQSPSFIGIRISTESGRRVRRSAAASAWSRE